MFLKKSFATAHFFLPPFGGIVVGAPDRNRTYDNPASEAGALSPELQAHIIYIIADISGKCKHKLKGS